MPDREYTYFEDLRQGDVFWSGETVVDREEMLEYNRRNDPWPFHIDEEEAKKTPFGGIIASGGYTITLMYRLTSEICNGPERPWAFLGGFDWELKFPHPVFPGDRLRCRVTIVSTRESSKPERGVVQNLIEVFNKDDKLVLSILSTALLKRRPGTAAVAP